MYFCLLQQIENLDKSYLEQKGELAALQERLDDLARERLSYTLITCLLTFPFFKKKWGREGGGRLLLQRYFAC